MTATGTDVPGASDAAAAIASLLARAQDGPVRMLVLTDEEVTVLGGGPEVAQVAPRPWLDVRDAAEHELACAVALRGLTVRNLALPVRTGEQDGGGEIRVHPDVGAALLMRQNADLVVVARRTGGGADLTRVLYRHGGGAVLEEDVSPAGLHGFTVTAAAAAAGRLAGFADPAGVAGEQAATAPQTVSLTAVAAGEQLRGLGEARYVTAAECVRGNPGGDPNAQRLTVFALDDKVVLADFAGAVPAGAVPAGAGPAGAGPAGAGPAGAGPAGAGPAGAGGPAGADGAGTVTTTTVGATALRERLAALLTASPAS